MRSFHKENRRLSGELYQHPLCGRLFMLDELHEMTKNSNVATSSALSIEAQLWIQPAEDIVKKLAP